jgi:hypothetical protein
MTDVTINTGATVRMSAGLPTTYDNNITTGYASLTLTDIGEIVDVSELAKAWSMVNHQSLARTYAQKLKDTYDISDVTLTLGRVSANAGQVLIQTALASSASYSFEITLSSGDTANFTGKVTKAGLGAIAPGAILTTSVSIAIDPESLYEA